MSELEQIRAEIADLRTKRENAEKARLPIDHPLLVALEQQKVELLKKENTLLDIEREKKRAGISIIIFHFVVHNFVL
jgi:hypothetical protein